MEYVQIDQAGLSNVCGNEFRGDLDGVNEKSEISRNCRAEAELFGENLSVAQSDPASQERGEGACTW